MATQHSGDASSSADCSSEKQSHQNYFYLGTVELSPLNLDDHRCTNTNVKVDKNEPSNGETGTNSDEVSVRSIEERIIDQLDYAQLCGDIIRQPKDDTKCVSVDVSTNGVKFLNATDSQRTVERLAMHKIVQCLSYENEIGSCNVAIVVTKNDSNLTCHLLQTESHDDADSLCEQILDAFQSIEQEAGKKQHEERERRRELEQKRRLRKEAQ